MRTWRTINQYTEAWRPSYGTNDISIQLDIRPTFAVLCFKMNSTDHNEILHTSRQCNCRDVWKIL